MGITGRFIPVLDIIEILCGGARAAAEEDSDWRIAGMEAIPVSSEGERERAGREYLEENLKVMVVFVLDIPRTDGG